MKNPVALLGNPSERTTPGAINWLRQSKLAAVVWTAARVWLGIMWMEAGVAKLWGAENPAFLHNNGAGVAGFASHGVAAYSWWGSFLHSFVVPNSGWIGILVAVAEFAIGIALVLGIFTRVAALGSLAFAAMAVGSPCSSRGGVPRITQPRLGPRAVKRAPSLATTRVATPAARCSSSTV